MKKYLFVLCLVAIYSSSFAVDTRKLYLEDIDVVVPFKIKHSDCKSAKSLESGSQDCVEYQVINNNYLKIKRINIAFNCCIDGVLVLIKDTEENEIIIHENEIISTPCNCICLYDIEYTLGPLDFGTYTFNIIEQYADTMKFEVDFTPTTNGKYCEERTGYPWDVQ